MASPAIEQVTLWLDGLVLATFDGPAEPPYRVWWQLTAGGVTVTGPTTRFTVHSTDAGTW